MSNFKNEPVEQIIGWLEENRDEFTARKAGAAWRAIALATADTFKEDRPQIYESLLGSENQRGPIIKSGGATITRLTPTDPVITGASGGCKDCPDTGAAASSGKPLRVLKVGKNKTTGEPVTSNTGADSADNAAVNTAEPGFFSPEDVLERFEADSEMMIAYAKQNGIDVGRATKPETLAERIFNHYAGE